MTPLTPSTHDVLIPLYLTLSHGRAHITYQGQRVEGLPRVPQLPPPHHPGKVRDKPQEPAAVAAEQGKGARGGPEARRGEDEGRERGMGVHQGLEGGAEASADSGLGDISLEDGVVDVAVLAVGIAAENRHLIPRRHVMSMLHDITVL